MIYQEGLKHHPGEYILYYSMGMTYTRLNDFSNAMEYYKKAATINGIANVATLNMGQISLIFKSMEKRKDISWSAQIVMMKDYKRKHIIMLLK